MDKGNVVEKVRKLLALAKNNPYECEAQACMLKAQRLMAEHNLSMANIPTESELSKEATQSDLTSFSRTLWWKKELALVIAKNFRCETFKQINRKMKQSKLVILGLTEDVEMAKCVFNFAVDAINYNAEEYLKRLRRKGRQTKGVRNTYILGFIDGLRTQFADQIKQNGWGLVLVKDPLVAEALANYNLKKGRASTIQVSRNQEARLEGYSKGKSFQAPAGYIETKM